jgi:hypothetical protein
MLTFKLRGDILEVRQTVLSFTVVVHTYWYYNIKTWCKSSFGKKDDVPDREMTETDIAWVKRYYLPKVGVKS